MIATSGRSPSGRAAVVAVFVAGPVLLTCNALFHPDVNTPAQAAESALGQPGAWYAVHVAGALGAIAFSVIGAHLVRLGAAWRRRPVVVAGVLSAVGGWFFSVEQASHGLMVSALLHGDAEPAVVAGAWRSFLEMGETAPVETGSMVFALSLLVLAVDLVRRSPVPRWTGWALLAFIVTSMAADTSGPVWIVFGALYTAPFAVLGARAARLPSPRAVEPVGTAA